MQVIFLLGKYHVTLKYRYIIPMQIPAAMVMLGWLVGQVLIVGVLRSASSTCGEQSAVITGHPKMPEWFADSWDTQEVVSLKLTFLI